MEEKKQTTYEFRWRQGVAREESRPVVGRGHCDPTADAAIARADRELRRKKRSGSRNQNSGMHTQQNVSDGGESVRERKVEQSFVDAVRKAGGLALKFTSQSMNGVPDRLVLLPGGKAAFVELKAPGRQMRPQQRKRRVQLTALGFPVLCVDRTEQIIAVVEALQAWQPGEIPPEGIGAAIPEIQNVRLPEGGDAR